MIFYSLNNFFPKQIAVFYAKIKSRKSKSDLIFFLLHSASDWGWGRFFCLTFFKPNGQTCVGHCGTWFFNKSRGINPGDHFAKISLPALQFLFSKVDFSKVAQQCHIDIFVYRGNLSNSTQRILYCTGSSKIHSISKLKFVILSYGVNFRFTSTVWHVGTHFDPLDELV